MDTMYTSDQFPDFLAVGVCGSTLCSYVLQYVDNDNLSQFLWLVEWYNYFYSSFQHLTCQMKRIMKQQLSKSVSL